MSSGAWESLTDDEKELMASIAKEEYHKSKASRCYWCGATLNGSYDKTSSSRVELCICKGYCHNERFFD